MKIGTQAAYGFFKRLHKQFAQPKVIVTDKAPSISSASITIKGIEALRGIYKKNRRNGTLFGFLVSNEIKVLMEITA